MTQSVCATVSDELGVIFTNHDHLARVPAEPAHATAWCSQSLWTAECRTSICVLLLLLLCIFSGHGFQLDVEACDTGADYESETRCGEFGLGDNGPVRPRHEYL